jgi:hypothetical protein
MKFVVFPIEIQWGEGKFVVFSMEVEGTRTKSIICHIQAEETRFRRSSRDVPGRSTMTRSVVCSIRVDAWVEEGGSIGECGFRHQPKLSGSVTTFPALYYGQRGYSIKPF